MWKTHRVHENPPHAALSCCTWLLLSQQNLAASEGHLLVQLGILVVFREKLLLAKILVGCSCSTPGHWKRQKNDVARMQFLSRWKMFSIAPGRIGHVQRWCFPCKSLAPLTDSPRELANQVFTLRKCHEASAEFTQKHMRQLLIKSAHNGWSLSTLRNKLI